MAGRDAQRRLEFYRTLQQRKKKTTQKLQELFFYKNKDSTNDPDTQLGRKQARCGFNRFAHSAEPVSGDTACWQTVML